ncbi:ABC-three component system protein [Limosilactobacillus fermentum]|uniref:ABC-three component system protein n=1 Tax=Limosilactobacillus fermentum TaxID=1613 RepID=UPI001FB72D59|nr:ABC-three component system protein [Limosilactobacillus fermentum]UOG12537.1 hypothetical protein MRD09_07905 [Limosilactobacillus fermentum]
MVRFDFAEYAMILKKYMIHKNALGLIGALYDSIVVPLDLKNEKGPYKGESIKVSSGRASELMNRKVNPHKSIISHSGDPRVQSRINSYFEDSVIPLLMGNKLDELSNALIGTIKHDAEIPEDTKKLLDKSRSSELSEFLAECFLYVLTVDNTGKPAKNLKSIKNIPQSTLSYDPSDHKLHIDNLEIPLSENLIVPEKVGEEELPYLNALCEAYSDKLGQTITVQNVKSCSSKRVKMDFEDERNYFNSVQSRIRGIRDVYADTDGQYEILKREAYEGIKETYYDDYDNGFKRLMGVLKKITSTTLDVSDLMKISNLIGNAEKKGLCHVLVNDGKIQTWVDIDEW